jgi:hypothetical protein
MSRDGVGTPSHLVGTTLQVVLQVLEQMRLIEDGRCLAAVYSEAGLDVDVPASRDVSARCLFVVGSLR